MVVEVFEKGTNPAFSVFLGIYHDIVKIDNTWNFERFILVKSMDRNIVLDANKTELKVSL